MKSQLTAITVNAHTEVEQALDILLRTVRACRVCEAHLPLGPRPTGHMSLTATTRDWRAHAPRVIPLPHPSPRNIAWFKANPWFDDELVPVLRQHVHKLVGG